MKKTLILLILPISLLLNSCEKIEYPLDTPPCIIAQIELLKENSICDDPSIDEYRFQEELVYVLSPGTCGADMGAGVSDSECNSLGFLGGFIGNTKINGEEFGNAVFIRNIWKKK